MPFRRSWHLGADAVAGRRRPAAVYPGAADPGRVCLATGSAAFSRLSLGIRDAGLAVSMSGPDQRQGDQAARGRRQLPGLVCRVGAVQLSPESSADHGM